MGLKWFDTSKVDAFSASLVKLFADRFPASEFSTPGKRQEERFRKLHALMVSEVLRFRRENRLNIYLKARLANKVKWSMKEAGYPGAFIDELAFELAALTAQRDS
ncbi:MAG: hypothetical protein HYX47_05990 [Burkholderiales bacterium]|nr:hypothetical protein [Burkholderiales bacterium]